MATLAVSRRFDLVLIVFATLPLRLVNFGLKALNDNPGLPEGLVRVTESANGLGFPSGHTMGWALLYGVL